MPEKIGVIYGKKAHEQIKQTVREVARRMMNEQPHRGRWQQTAIQRVRVALTSALTAPATSAGAPTTATAAVLVPDATTGYLEDSTDRITITNFDESLTAADGTYGKAEFIGGVWELYWVSCSPSSDFVALT